MSIEALITQAYVQLLDAPRDEQNWRTVSLAKYVHYEVRLIERLPVVDAEIPCLWVELYAADVQTSIDSCGCDDVETAVVAAEYLISQGRKLEEEAIEAAGSTRRELKERYSDQQQ